LSVTLHPRQVVSGAALVLSVTLQPERSLYSLEDATIGEQSSADVVPTTALCPQLSTDQKILPDPVA
jgi:hypothetical protein